MPDLVLIPALFCDEALYAPVLPKLAEHATVHVMAAPRDTMEESVAAILESPTAPAWRSRSHSRRPIA